MTYLQVYRRYLRLEPAHAEEYITYLKLKGRWGEAAQKLAEVVNDETFRWAGAEGAGRAGLRRARGDMAVFGRTVASFAEEAGPRPL